MTEKVEGILLTSQDYGETSRIINVITKKYGVIGMIAKGAKSMKSPMRSSIDKLTYGTFTIYYKENKLSIVSSIDIINPLKNIRKDIEKISYASYLLDLTGQVLRQNKHASVYDLLVASLIKIEEGFDPMVIMNILELKYLDNLGVMPVLDCCSKCGRKDHIVTVSSYLGGYVCSNCYTNEKMVSEKTIKLLRMFYYIDIAKIEKIEIAKEVKEEINYFLDEYYDRYTGLYLNSKNFIRNLKKLNI